MEYPVTSSMLLYMPFNSTRWATDIWPSAISVTKSWYTIWEYEWVESVNITWYMNAQINFPRNYTISFWAYIPNGVTSTESIYYKLWNQNNSIYLQDNIIWDIYATWQSASNNQTLIEGFNWWAYFVSVTSGSTKYTMMFYWDWLQVSKSKSIYATSGSATFIIWNNKNSWTQAFKDWYISNLVIDSSISTDSNTYLAEYNKYKSAYWY